MLAARPRVDPDFYQVGTGFPMHRHIKLVYNGEPIPEEETVASAEDEGRKPKSAEASPA